MKLTRALRRPQTVAVTAGVTAVAIVASLLAAQPVQAVGSGVTYPDVVNAVPAAFTPNITDGTVFAITQVGNEVIVGGSFTAAQDHGSTATPVPTHTYVLGFDASTGALSTTFNPTLDGSVQAVAAGPIAGTVYVGGSFATVNGVKSKGITLLNVTDNPTGTAGTIVTGFTPPALDGIVYSVGMAANRLYLAGSFTTANTIPHGGLATLNPTTGVLDAFMNVQTAGHHNFNGTTGSDGAVGPRAMAINPAGTRAVVIGNFKTVDGLARDQIVMLDLDGASAAVDLNWQTVQYTAACSRNAFDTYMTDVQYSADGSYFAVTATGGGSTNNSDGSPSLCDSVSRWESSATGTGLKPTWIDLTGRDTLWSVAVTGNAIYVGGHERWLNNSNGQDNAGAGAVPRPGVAALDPASGVPLSWNPGRNPRGAGAYALFAGPSGLYVGSDTDYIGNSRYKHQKIAFFPLAGGVPAAATTIAQLPSNLYQAGPLPSGDDLDYRSIKGATIGPLTTVANTGIPWSTTRGAFMVGNSIFYGNDTGSDFDRASFDGTTLGTTTLLDPYDDPYWDSVPTGSNQTYQGVKSGYYGEMAGITGAFYSNGKLYYSQSGKSGLYWRWFSPDSGTIGSQEFTVNTSGFNFGSSVAGMVLSGSTLYYAATSGGALHSRPFASGSVTGTDTLVNSDNWASRSLFLYGTVSGPNQLPTAVAAQTCTGLECSFDGSGSLDPDGTIASYVWDFGDPAGTTTTTTTPTTTYTYAAEGTYPVTLTVTDNSGGVSPTPWTQTETVRGTAALSMGPATAISYGTSLTVTTHLQSPTSGSPIVGATVTLYSRGGTSGPFRLAATRTTTSTGGASVTVTPRVSAFYQWRYGGSSAHSATNSVMRSVAVAQLVSIHQSASLITRGGTLTLWGTVAPNEVGQYVYLQSHNSTGWHTSAYKAKLVLQKLPNGSTAVGSIIRFAPRGGYYRTCRPATSVNSAGYSMTVIVRIRAA